MAVSGHRPKARDGSSGLFQDIVGAAHRREGRPAGLFTRRGALTPSVHKGPEDTLETSPTSRPLTPDGLLQWLQASGATGPRWPSSSLQGRAPQGHSSPKAAAGADGRGAGHTQRDTLRAEALQRGRGLLPAVRQQTPCSNASPPGPRREARRGPGLAGQEAESGWEAGAGCGETAAGPSCLPGVGGLCPVVINWRRSQDEEKPRG